MNNIKEWAKDTAIRAIKTAAQTAVGVIGAATVLTEVDWLVVASAAALSAIVCALMNVHKLPGGGDE